jgi:AbrB family looped-hinge helix DNA binding protein
MNAVTKLSTKGQVVIPKDVRDALGWPEGQTLIVRQSGGRAILEPPTPPREKIDWQEFRRRVPRYNGPPVATEDMTTRIGELFRDWKD